MVILSPFSKIYQSHNNHIPFKTGEFLIMKLTLPPLKLFIATSRSWVNIKLLYFLSVEFYPKLHLSCSEITHITLTNIWTYMQNLLHFWWALFLFFFFFLFFLFFQFTLLSADDTVLRGRCFISIRFWYDDVYIKWWWVLKHT